ncbi:hypothetical protein SAMD00024442_17_4 [Candidatus Symbiothrix dinenymphae]|nr:hypothetical protein SAMD00024442_17_4 [Candidatus Symbiothrix dinenymphae]
MKATFKRAKAHSLRGKVFCSMMMAMAVVSFIGCENDGDDAPLVAGIPRDSSAEPNPDIGTATMSVPNFLMTVKKESGHDVLYLDMTGIQNPQTKEWLTLTGGESDQSVWKPWETYSAGSKQNVWLSIDGKPKGIAVLNNSNIGQSTLFMTDVVLLVDNSGSMSEEADAIALDIIDWAAELSNSRLDVRFGCVGYDDLGSISGALNITDEKFLSTYLQRAFGTDRTVGFSGFDAATLEQAANDYGFAGGECGVLALRFADENLSFRKGALRTYVNFTDEPNQPRDSAGWSVEFVNSQNNWPPSKGTIHTVFSDDTTFFDTGEFYSYEEKPWEMSRYTGGTELFVSSDFSGVTLNTLPVTGALQNAYQIRAVVDEYMNNKPHVVTLTIFSENGQVKAKKEVSTIFTYQ